MIDITRLKQVYATLQKGGYSQDFDTFRKGFAGNENYANRKKVYDLLSANGAKIGKTYEEFMQNMQKPKSMGNPTVNKYRQQMFNSVDPNKSRASELTHRAVGQAVRATNNVRKPVVAKVVNKNGKPTGEEFAITPAKTAEDLDREYAQETTKNWENELNDQMDDADKDAAKISDMFKSFIGSTDEVGSVWGNMTRGGGIAGTPHSVTTNNGILENTEARQILAAGDYNRKRRELLQLEKDSRNGAIFDNHSFFRGIYDAAKDTGFLTGGASDLINAGSMLATKQDLDNGVHTEAGDMLIQQAVKNSDAQSQYVDNQGWMYTGGVITTNMAPFIMQIASAGFSKGMSNAIGKVVQGAASKVALGTMEKATGMAGANIANYIGKVTGLTTKAFGKAIQYGIVGAAQANTVGLGNVANDVINRYTGQVYQDEQGNYKFGTFDSDGKLVHEGGEDFLTALVKGEAAKTIEFATELAGGGIDAVGTALKNFVTKGGKKIINKYNMENVSKVIGFLLNNKVSKNARYLKAGADRTLGKVELNSIVGESLEEELGIIANTVFTGDNKISDLWDEKQQSQIWGGMLLSIGLMKGAVAPFHAYNAKQYYSYKHKLDKADVNLSQLLGKEKWEELRNQIDATTNDDMTEMVNKINRDVALGKNRQPVREYIQNLLIMRGYDIGNMLAAKKAVEDKGEGVSVKNMEKNQAYQQGRDAYGYDTHEIQLDQEDKQKSLAKLLGISEQQLASMSDEELEALSGRDDNIDRAIYDYQLSTARYEGVIDKARDQIDLEVQIAAQAVDMYTDKSRNTIRNATIKATGGLEDYGVYIINGNIATHEDGSIDISNSDDMILYYDPTTNTVEHADATMFAELGSEENADEVRSQAMADAKEKAIKETTGIIDGVVEVGTQFKTVGADGTEHTYEVLADNGDGTAMITIDGNIPTELVKGENVQVPVSFEELQKMKDASDQQRLQAAKAQREQMEKERAEQQMQEQTTQAENPAQEDNIQSAPIEDNLDYSDIIREDGKVQMVDVSDKDGNNLFPDAKDVFYIQGNKMRTKFAYIDANGELKTQSFPTGLVKIKTRGEVSVDDYKKYRSTILSAESSAMPESSMIEDNSGENRGDIEVENQTIDGESAAPTDVVAAPESAETPATEQTPAAPAMTLEDGTIVPMLEDGNPDFSKLTAEQTAELYDTQFGEDADSIVSGYVSDAKKALDKASNMTVKGKTFVEQKAAKDAKEKAIADAQAAYDSAIAIRDAYNERQLAKVEDTAEGRKALIEKARRKFARLKIAVKDDAEAVSQLYRETIGSLLHRLYDSTGIDVTDTTPLTAEEYVASNLGAHSLNYEGTEKSNGVKQETGLSREDFAKTQLLAADGKGTTIDALVHSLWENRPSNLESLDTQDIRNALIGVLNSGFRASEARNFVENIRIAQAENILEEQKRAQENAAYAEQQKAETESELEAKSDEKAEPEAKLEEKLDNESDNKYNDLSNESYNEKINDKINDNINAPEVPEDATDENPLGLQLSEDKVPFEIEGGKSGETYDINDNEDRQRLINDNKVDDKDILDIDMPKHVHKAIKELCKKMGLKVQFLYMGARSNGWIENGTMYLALDTENATQFVFGHEMTHAIKQKNPEAYKELVKVAMAVTTKNKFEEDLAKVYQNYHGIYGYNNVDDYVEEVVADNLGKFINDFDLAQKFSLRLNHPILGTIIHAIQKIKSLLYGDFYKSVDALERIVEKAYVETANGQVTNSETGEDVSFSLRQKPEPKKKGVGYKVFVLKDGKLYPPMVANPDGAATPVGVWLDADAAPIAGESKTGRPQVKQGGKGTQGGSGKLAYRPGWHLGVVPYAIQFNRKDADGNKTLFPKNFVFAEVEYAADVDYQEEARQEGINPSGKYQHSLAGLKHLPTDGYYMYRTNPNPDTDPWVITGAMKVNRILTRAEQAELVKNAGREPQQIQEGDIVTDDVVNRINQEIADAPKFSLKVYHGSGADFTEFDFDHMGEGAGSQVFGWGGYVTSSEEIGKSYANLSRDYGSRNIYKGDIQLTKLEKAALSSFIENNKKHEGTFKEGVAGSIERQKALIAKHPNNPLSNSIKKRIEVLEGVMPKLDSISWDDFVPSGKNLYEVDIPEDNGSNYLEWEKKPSDEVSTKIIEGLYGLDAKILDDMASKDIVFRTLLYDYIKNADKEQMIPLLVKTHALTRGTTYDNGNVEDNIRFVYNRLSRWMGSPKAASQFLSSLGFTGIKYPAGTIMGGAEENDTNYVIFNPEDMRITEHTKFSIKTYHGSQASFDKFDHSFMGSGEGAQAYGWGTYVSEVEGIAKAYAKSNTAKRNTEYTKAKSAYESALADIDLHNKILDGFKNDIEYQKENISQKNEMIDEVSKYIKENYEKDSDKYKDGIRTIEKFKKIIDRANETIESVTSAMKDRQKMIDLSIKERDEAKAKLDSTEKPKRNLYSVDIPDDTGENYIGWDEKMTPRMRDIRKEILENNGYKLVDSDETRDYFEDRDGKEYELFKEQYKTGGTFYEELAQLLHSQKLASLALKEYGFDGVKVIAERNTGGNKEGKMNYVIFDENNAKITSHTKFSLKDEKTIAGVHNITEEKLRKALKLGGFANPSLAVIDTNKNVHDNFGEISFIAPSALLDKRTGNTAGTWITDAYTQRYPSVERQMSEKGSQKFEDWVDSLEYSSAAKAEIKRQTKDVMEDNGVPAWELMYLKENGIDIKAYDSNVDYRWKEIINDHPTAEDILSSMKNDPELKEKVTSLAKHSIIYPTWEKVSLEVRRKMYKETGVKASPINPQVRKQTKEIFERDYKSTLLNKDGSPRKKDVKKVVEDIVKEHNDTKKYDFYLSKVKASNYVNKNGLYDDYIRWQENKLDEFGTKNRIFRGYTRDGSRKYVPETLENVSKAMREEADGQTNGSEYTSFGSFIAKLASRVDSTDEMRANKDKLSTNKDKEEFYEKWSEVYYDLAKFLYNDVFYGEQRLHDIVLQSDPKKYAKKEYGITLTPTFMKKLDALKNAVQKELKSAYFETKYNRPLRLNEFAAAVVPDNLGEDVRKGIENAGLPMYEYDPNKEGDRTRAFNEAINSSDNIRFSLKEEKEKIVADAKANGTYMTAPNGEKTKLDAEQWATVRTTNFKNWFGDWENDPDNASKVVDENGEPMVVWHGRSAEFNTFEKKEGVRFIMGLEDKVKSEGFFFSPDKGLAEEFASNSSRHRGGKANVVPCFLNIRKPMDLTGEDYDRIYEYVTGWEYMVGMDTQDNLWGIMDEEGMADKIKEKGYDGAIFVEEVDDSYEPTKISYCALDANQIKSAENNNGDFSADNNDIRFSLAGERGAAAADKAEERTARMDNLSVARKMEEEKKDANAIKMATGWERGADGKWRYEIPDAKIKDTMDIGGGHIVKRYEDDMLWNGGKLSDVIDAPELFKAYPQLKNVRIETDAIMNDMPSNGEYNSKTNTITIHADELKYMNGILNHEIQHAIQDIEGFAKGGSPRLVRGEVKNRFDEVTKQIKQLRAEGKEDEAKDLIEKNRGLYNAYQKNDDYNSYKSLAGEVEARNVQERMNMTSEERRKTLAESTEDVARKDQIFLGVGDVSFSLRDMADGKESGAADMAEDLKSLNTPDEVDDAIKTAIDDMPSGWQMANKKMIHIAQAIGDNRKAEIAGEEPKFSLKDGTLIKSGTYFSGGGLVEEGLKGIIDPVVAVEYDEKISGVYRNNFGQHIVTADVRDVDPRELVKQIDGEVEYFHASPVCKNYSQANSNHAEVELDKETASSTAEFINAIKPKVVTIENVKGYKDSEAMKIITDALDANGYTWDADVYNAADYGGYTNRERLIVRAVRDGKLPEKPKKMAHKSGWYEAVADIIPTLTEKKNGVAHWMDIRLKADGIDWRNIDKPLYVMGSAYADGKVPHAFADELLPTLRTKSGDVIVMPDGKVYRAMGRVLARVSGVSDDYKMPFSENLSHTIIGNGIPTQLTEHVIAPLLTGYDPKFSLKKTNNVKYSRIIPTDVDKSVSSQIEKKYDSAIKEVMNKVAERDKRLVSNYIEQDLSDFSKMRREDINQELKSNENWRRKNLREENREGSTYGITDARHRITEATAERELEYRDVRAKYLSETYGLQGGRQTSLVMVDRAFEDTLGNETNRGELRELYGKARKILVHVGAEFGGVSNAKQEGDFGFAGTDRDISLFIDTMTRTSTPQSELAHTILHEMIHQATVGSINLVKKGMADGMLTPKQIEAVNTIINTYDAYKADRRLVWEEDNYRDYGGKDEYEFAAEMADAKQRRILSIPYGERILNAANELKRVGDISLWQAIKNALRRLFEVSDKSKMDKALTDIMDDFNKNIDDISMNNIEQTDFGLNGNTRFSLRGSTSYDKQMEEWMEKNHLEKGAVPMEKPIMKEGENIFDYANRMVEWTRNQNLWKTAPKQTGFQDALDKWKADNGLSPDSYPPVRPHRENYSTEIGYAEDLEEYNKKKELWKSAPKPKDFDLSVDLDDMNKQLRNIRRAVLNQKNYDQRTVKAVSDLVRKMLNIGWGDGLSRGKVGNLLSAAKNATGANDVKKYLDKAMGILADNYLNRLSTAYDNLINTKGARADQSGVIKMGSLDAKGQAFMSEYKKAINMDDSSLNTYIANIEEDSAKNEDNVEMNDYRLAGIQAAIMYKQQIGGNDADIAELKRQIVELKNKKDATKEDKDLLKSLEKKLFENKFDRITMYENLLNNIQRMVKESKGRAKEFREEIAEHKNEILHRANLDLEGVDSTYYDTTTAKKKFVNNDLQRAVFSSTYTFEQFLKFFGKKAANGEGYLYNYFTKLNQDALDEEQLYNEMNRNALDEKTKELFGKKKFMKLVGIDGKGMKEMDVEVTDYSNKETGKRTIHLKQGQMLYIYLVNKETDGEMKLRAMGITEEDVAAIEENLDQRVKAIGEWLQDEYLPECQRRYQATHTKYFGAHMKEVENYFPLAINNRARNVKEDVNQDSDAMSQLAGTSTGAIVTRRVNVIPLDIENADAFEVAFNHLQEMEEWSAMLPFRQDINTLLSYTHFRNQVQNMSSVAYGSGKTLWDEFKQTAQIAAGTYKPKVNAGMMDSRIAAAMGGIAVAKISGRLWTAIKQSQSATVFLPECDFTRFVKNGVNPYGSWKWAMENIPDFRKRVEKMTYGDVKLRQYLDELEKLHDWTKTISKIGMAPNILVDGITCAVGARSVYETEVNRLNKLGYPKEKAEEKAYYKSVAAYNKTQQSSGGMYLSPMQVDRTYVSAALSLFKNANYAYGRMQIEACRGLARTYDFWGGKHKTTLIESMTRQIMEEDGLDENTARAIAKATYNRTFRQSIGRLINFATLVPVSWALYKVLPYLLTGDDDDKKKDMIEEAVLKGFATSLSDNYVIPFASNILNAGLKVEDGKPTFDPEVFRYQNLYINPATSDLANIYSMVGNQKWYSVANKLGMLGVQSLIGFNPETVGALYQALSEADYDNGNTAKEWQIGILKAISAPEESIRELYMDELGLKSGDIKKIPLAELEKRYAERQINRDNLLSQIGMDAETFNGYVDKYQKSFEKKIKDKMDKWDEYDKKKADEFFDTTSDTKLKDMIEKKRAKDANAAADEQIAKEGLNQEKKGKEPSEEAYDAVKMSIDVAEDNAISTYNKVLNKRYAALNDEYNEQTDAMKYIFMSKHPNFKAYKELESEYTKYGKKINELKEKLVSADGYDAKQTILKQIRAEREKFIELQSKVR